MLRQGDVLILPAVEIPADLTPQRGRLVLATGESTGHAHVIEDDTTTLWGDDLDRRFLEVVDAATLVHTSTPVEHDPLVIPPGVWEVRRQREYTPEAVRLVAD